MCRKKKYVFKQNEDEVLKALHMSHEHNGERTQKKRNNENSKSPRLIA